MTENEPDGTASPDPLESAIAFIRERVCSDGPDGRGVPEGELYGAEWRAFIEWCEQNERVLDPSFYPLREGGREHDLTYYPFGDEFGSGWVKYTKPDLCGYAVSMVGGKPLMLPATPSQYLERCRLQNMAFGDKIELMGLARTREGNRISIWQPDLVGDAPQLHEIDACLQAEFDFSPLNIEPMGSYKSVSYIRGDVGLFDVHVGNFVRTLDGHILPIDVILVEFSPEEARDLRIFAVGGAR